MVRLLISRSRSVEPTSLQPIHNPIWPVLQLWEMLQAREQQACETHQRLAADWDAMDNDPMLRSQYHRARGEEQTLDVMIFSIRCLAAREADDLPIPSAPKQASAVYQLLLGALVSGLPQIYYSRSRVYRLGQERDRVYYGGMVDIVMDAYCVFDRAMREVLPDLVLRPQLDTGLQLVLTAWRDYLDRQLARETRYGYDAYWVLREVLSWFKLDTDDAATKYASTVHMPVAAYVLWVLQWARTASGRLESRKYPDQADDYITFMQMLPKVHQLFNLAQHPNEVAEPHITALMATW